MKFRDVPITLDELRTLAGSAIVDIHAEVDEIFADGLRRISKADWTAANLSAKRDHILTYFDRAIELCEALEKKDR